MKMFIKCLRIAFLLRKYKRIEKKVVEALRKSSFNKKTQREATVLDVLYTSVYNIKYIELKKYLENIYSLFD